MNFTEPIFSKKPDQKGKPSPHASNIRGFHAQNISADPKKIPQWLPDDLPANPKKWVGRNVLSVKSPDIRFMRGWLSFLVGLF